MKKIFLYMLMAVGMLSVQSCLHDNEDTFDTPAAQRIIETVAADKALLESATNGWHLEYYLGEEYLYGGINYFVKFANGKAYVAGEPGGPDSISVSSYDVITDMGPVLTFNTYNEIMHEYAQPYSSATEGYQGDFEFVIMKTTNDSIYLQGKKWGNKMLMTRVAEGASWDDYLSKVSEVQDALLFADYKANIGGIDTDVEFDTDYSSFNYKDEEGNDASMPFIYTTSGVKLREPVTINGVSLQYFDFDCNDTDQWFIAKESQIRFEGQPIEGWRPYATFEGTYDLKYNKGTLRVQLVPAGDGTSYYLLGLSDKFAPKMTWSKRDGRLSLLSQQVGSDTFNGTTFQIWIAAWDTSQGYLSWGTEYGMYLVPNEDDTEYSFKNNEQWPGYIISGFIMWRLNADGSASAGNMNTADTYGAWYINGSPQFARPTTLTRVSE